MEFSDDLSLVLARGESVVSLVEYVAAAQSAGTAWPEVLGVLTERFALSFDDARLAVDCVPGGVVRAASGNAANEPDRVRDPVAWVSYQRARGLPVPAPEPMATPEQSAAAFAVVEAAQAGEATRGTTDVVVALEVVRSCVAFVGEPAVQRRLMIQAATSVSTAAEARIAALGSAPYAIAGSRDWADGVVLAAAARVIAERFAWLGESSFEDGAYELAGRITTRVLGQSPALVGRVMLDSRAAHCAWASPPGRRSCARWSLLNSHGCWSSSKRMRRSTRTGSPCDTCWLRSTCSSRFGVPPRSSRSCAPPPRTCSTAHSHLPETRRSTAPPRHSPSNFPTVLCTCAAAERASAQTVGRSGRAAAHPPKFPTVLPTCTPAGPCRLAKRWASLRVDGRAGRTAGW